MTNGLKKILFVWILWHFGQIKQIAKTRQDLNILYGCKKSLLMTNWKKITNTVLFQQRDKVKYKHFGIGDILKNGTVKRHYILPGWYFPYIRPVSAWLTTFQVNTKTWMAKCNNRWSWLSAKVEIKVTSLNWRVADNSTSSHGIVDRMRLIFLLVHHGKIRLSFEIFI